MKRALLLIALIFIFFLLLGNFRVNTALSVATNIVISEIQVSGETSTDEFVELYNPTNDAVSLNNWKLTNKTPGGDESSIIDATMSGTIAPHGYFLVAHANYDGALSADQSYSGPTTVASDNTVLIYNSLGTLVDKVGMGTATDREGDPSPSPAAPDPSANHSIERKASATSDTTSMGPGGSEENAGNGEDTDNNASDFLSRTTPDPQNTNSAAEPALTTPTPSQTPTPSLTPTPSATPTPTPTNTPTPTPSATSTPTPSQTPTPTPTPIGTVTPTPTNSPTPTPTEEPTPTPSEEPTETLTPTPTEVPTETPTPTPTEEPIPTETPPSNIFFQSRLFTCSRKTIEIHRFGFTFFFPQFVCVRT